MFTHPVQPIPDVAEAHVVASVEQRHLLDGRVEGKGLVIVRGLLAFYQVEVLSVGLLVVIGQHIQQRRPKHLMVKGLLNIEIVS